MKLPSPRNPLVLILALLISAGTASHLAAQAPLTSGDAIFAPPTVVAFVPSRSYTGTATQTTAAGVKTTGTLTLLRARGGQLSATTTFDGVSTTYGGALPRVSYGRVQGKRTGYLFVSLPTTTTNPEGMVAYATVFVPLIVDKSVASGGLQNIDGSTLTFYAERDAMIVGSGH